VLSAEDHPVSGGADAASVTIARIRTTHGRRGEVAAEILTDFPERFQPGLSVTVRAEKLHRSFTLEAAWFHKGRVILKFQGLDTLSEAETLAGALVQVPRSERHPLPPGRLYVSDLMGCSVVEGDQELGQVAGWEETGAVPLLRVEGRGGEMLIPFTEEICCAVDIEKKEIRVRTPEGLRELNPSPAHSARRAARRQKK